ncbi:hypothetical protein SDC9_89772 [bioreactor metagenome]|uniref:Uncharacterized protein n=1 Tax=bioreactor metagenome TaxID=1076179 RepID=A0A644ZQ41_9ZZZZ
MENAHGNCTHDERERDAEEANHSSSPIDHGCFNEVSGNRLQPRYVDDQVEAQRVPDRDHEDAEIDQVHITQPTEHEEVQAGYLEEGLKAGREDETPDVADDDQADDVRDIEGCAQCILTSDITVQQDCQQQCAQVDDNHAAQGQTKGEAEGFPHIKVIKEEFLVVFKADEGLCPIQAIPLGEGGKYAHEKGYFHRDEDGRECRKGEQRKGEGPVPLFSFQWCHAFHPVAGREPSGHNRR